MTTSEYVYTYQPKSIEFVADQSFDAIVDLLDGLLLGPAVSLLHQGTYELGQRKEILL